MARFLDLKFRRCAIIQRGHIKLATIQTSQSGIFPVVIAKFSQSNECNLVAGFERELKDKYLSLQAFCIEITFYYNDTNGLFFLWFEGTPGNVFFIF